jgi:hypothetical protein
LAEEDADYQDGIGRKDYQDVHLLHEAVDQLLVLRLLDTPRSLKTNRMYIYVKLRAWVDCLGDQISFPTA